MKANRKVQLFAAAVIVHGTVAGRTKEARSAGPILIR
jgi:hypothetical protein